MILCNKYQAQWKVLFIEIIHTLRHFVIFSSLYVDHELDAIVAAATFYRCPVCKYEFSAKTSFITHFHGHLSIVYEQTDNDPIDIDLVNCIVEETIEERFLCSFCYHAFVSTELVREHMINVHRDMTHISHSLLLKVISLKQDHQYVPIDTDDAQPPDQPVKTIALQQQQHPAPADCKDKEHGVESDEWLRPISLKELKKKLTKSFVIK